MKDQDKEKEPGNGGDAKQTPKRTAQSEDKLQDEGDLASTNGTMAPKSERQQQEQEQEQHKQQQEQDLQKLKEVTKASTSGARRPLSGRWNVSANSNTNTSTRSISTEDLPPIPRKTSSMLQKQKENRSTRSITTEDLAPPRPPRSNRSIQLQSQKDSRSTRSITTDSIARPKSKKGLLAKPGSSRMMTMTGSIVHSAYHSAMSDDGAVAGSENNGSSSAMMSESFNDSIPTQDAFMTSQPGSSRNFNDSQPTQDAVLSQPGSSRNFNDSQDAVPASLRTWNSSRNFNGSSVMNNSAAGSEFAVPGAIAIAGIDGPQNGEEDMEDDIIVTSGEADVPSQPQAATEHLVEALPITGDDEDYEQALKNDFIIRDEEKAAGRGIVAARPVPESEYKSYGIIDWVQRHKLLAAVTTLVFLAVIVSSVFGTGNNKGNGDSSNLKLSPRFQQALPIVTNITSEEILYDWTTPQYKALVWLADIDPAQLDFSTSTSSSMLVREGGNRPRILQRYALAVLFFATQGQYWNNTYGFLSEWDECQWAGYDNNGEVAGVASCNGDGLVTSLLLGGNQLNGTLPEEIGSFESLVVLRVGSNPSLYGSLPSSLTSLTNLRELSAYRCSLTGSLPQEIGKLNSLSYLAMNENSLSGNLPTTIGQLTLLEQLYLYNNQLEGRIPTEYGSLVDLRIAGLQSNQLSGSIPKQLSNLSSLKHADFSYNSFNDGASNLCSIDSLLVYVTDCYSRSFPTTINKEILCPCCTLCCSEQAETCDLN